MKKMSLLAASVAIALTGCGGGSGSDNTSTAQSGLEITAIDGYLKNAAVWVDTNENLVLDTGEDTKLDVVTNEYGKFTLPEEYKSQTVFIQAFAGQTEDTTRGIVTETFSLASTSGSSVVNPMTNMVVSKVAKQLASDPTLDVVAAKKAAKEEVVAKLTQSGLNVDASMIFGDYIAKADESKEAQALNAIGEALVDNADIDVEKQLEVADLVAKEANNIIENNGDMTDFAPVITVPKDDSPIVVEKNHRPTSSQAVEPIKVVLGEAITSFTASFTDIDDDTLTYELKALKLANGLNGLSINSTTGAISGTPESAGVFTYQVFATDEHKARSYPLTFTVTVEAPNTAPVVNEDVKAQLQAEVDAWYWVEGEQPVDTLNISTLFDDADSDLLTYTVETSISKNGGVETGFQVHVDGNGNISFDGPLPFKAAAGTESLYVYAKDSINADEPLVVFALPEIIEGTPVVPEPPVVSVADLQNKFLHFVEVGSNGTNYTNAWCDSIYFDSASNKLYWSNRTDANKQSCVDEDLNNFTSEITYTIEDGLIKSTNFAQDGISFELVESSIYDDDMSNHYLVKFNYIDDESEELESVTEVYGYYTDKREVEKEIYQPIGRSMDNAPWVVGLTHTVIDGKVQEFDVSGIVQQFDYEGTDGQVHTYTAASLYAEDAHACDVLKNDYTIRVMGSNDAAGSHFVNREFKIDNGCYLNMLPFNQEEAIPAGLYTIEAKPKRLDEGERVIFSFKK
ncbi:putative Ig domain-containing protein [Vibrio diabolicus]|uniref:putative Ig domain-containing protein n=2 Tax=Vibrio diabolicus TaxID=50719 RepID=UPI00215D59E3|nr:putative Ig domain-containing protein [Vibrio diabolicus]MCR9472654.1 putative Ig domain-containing protein [Vibrio diabolicus]MCR9610616.1 putative Ig domain-containing protein [Vibrio alginolyticus]MCR9614624.1 putative Ig domain-containing protein [Vibrio alginolyticus]MCS0327314.1 putative Ig domain-containing protein [Vibrio diabolicus]